MVMPVPQSAMESRCSRYAGTRTSAFSVQAKTKWCKSTVVMIRHERRALTICQQIRFSTSHAVMVSEYSAITSLQGGPGRPGYSSCCHKFSGRCSVCFAEAVRLEDATDATDTTLESLLPCLFSTPPQLLYRSVILWVVVHPKPGSPLQIWDERETAS